MGSDAFIIKYKYSAKKYKIKYIAKLKILINPISLIKYIFSKIELNSNRSINEEKKRIFDEFRKKSINFYPFEYSSIEDLKSKPPVCDTYIAGSDQIWNFSFSQNKISDIQAYTLNFGAKKTLRLSYASSFGGKEIENEYRESFIYNINKFKYISVRENDGIKFLKKNGVEKVDLLCDPTMLLSMEDYNSILNVEDFRKSDIFIYFLGVEPNINLDKIVKYVIRNKPNYYYTCTQGRKDKRANIYPSIEQWIGIIKNTDIVITNSYHGLIFSLIFNKKFYVLPLGNKYIGMNSRIDTILQNLNLKDRKINTLSEYIRAERSNNKIDWNKINKNIEEIVNKSKEYLEKIINN